jgi:hypothetical protein
MPDRVNLLRRDLRQSLELKNARMTCLISESCNAEAPFVVPRAVQAVVGPTNDKFESLFLGTNGYVDLNSSSKGEYSFTQVFGPLFAGSLSMNAPDSGKKMTWKKYTDDLRDMTAALYTDMRKQALDNPRVNDRTKGFLRGQPNQTVKVYVLPR